MIDWSAEYNALPFRVRMIGSAQESKLRIQHLNFEKDRLKKNYERSLREINEHIKNCEIGLRELESKYPPEEKE